MKRLVHALFVINFLLSLQVFAQANSNSAKNLSQKDIFIQISNDGTIRRGKIYINLPGKLRISYEEPNDLLITSMGFWLVVQNRKLKQNRTKTAGCTGDKLISNSDFEY